MNGEVLVHVGPSLPVARRPVLDHVVWLPPAQAGDALRAERLRPRVFVLIDGLFDGACAIRHNELLRLLARGVRVIGAASMGALRACELRTLGMEGVGRVFDAYVAGRLVGDDEVAMLHGPAELSWTPLTVPLVNIRATLAAARRRRMIDFALARTLLTRACAAPFMDRTWEALAQGDALPEGFGEFLRAGGVDVKQQDALAALDSALEAGVALRHPHPEHTIFDTRLAGCLDGAP